MLFQFNPPWYLPIGEAILACLILSGVYCCTLAIYRLYLHPLSKFPGPWYACISDQWLFWQVQIGDPEGSFEKLHERFKCNALRIAPNELHITDVSLYKQIYSNPRTPFVKEPVFYDGIGTVHTCFSELDPAKHKERRKMIAAVFAKSSILKLEPVIHETWGAIAEKLRRLSSAGPVELSQAFRCFTIEIVSRFIFDHPAGIINEEPDSFNAPYLGGMDATLQAVPLMTFWPITRLMMFKLPVAVTTLFRWNIGGYMKVFEHVMSGVQRNRSSDSKSRHPVILDSLGSLSEEYQCHEAMDMLFAGSETTAWSLGVALYHILSNPLIHDKLKITIRNARLDNAQPSLHEMEKLEYLSACVKEAVRLGSPIPGRLPRVVPEAHVEVLSVDGMIVPAGSVVNITARTMHHSESIWGSDARAFNPNRWMIADISTLEQNMVSFSKGPRQCLGLHLAYAEITIALFTLIRDFDLCLDRQQQAFDKYDQFTVALKSPGLLIRAKPT